MKTLRGYGTPIAHHITNRPWAYGWFGLAVLLATTLRWSLVSAMLQQSNADQLADGYLFENAHTFAQALFPASHTLLFKWPLFWLLSLLHSSPAATITLTVLVTTVCVGAFAYVLFKIIRRPLVFGTLCLLLACVLVLIPAQLLGGVTAPLNMAILTGRNIEYVLYVGALVLYARARSYQQWQWAVATLLLVLLIASDQLFVLLAIGGSILMLGAGYLWHHGPVRNTAMRWLAGSVTAWVLAKLLVAMVGRYLTGIVGSWQPYALVDDWHTVWPAVIYAIKAMTLNLGITTRNGSLALIPASVNTLVALAIIVATYHVVRRLSRSRTITSTAPLLTTMLVASTATAVVAYCITAHPYAFDARYLSIVLFAGFVGLATYMRTTAITPSKLLAVGVVALAASLIGLASLSHTPHHTADVLQQRNQRVAKTLQAHPTEILVGDYWQVLPIKAITPLSQQDIVPLQSCLQPIAQLRSNAWLVDLRVHSFAYLLPLYSSGTPFGKCNARTIEAIYGKPTATTIVDGTAHFPQTLLLFYDNGADNY